MAEGGGSGDGRREGGGGRLGVGRDSGGESDSAGGCGPGAGRRVGCGRGRGRTGVQSVADGRLRLPLRPRPPLPRPHPGGDLSSLKSTREIAFGALWTIPGGLYLENFREVLAHPSVKTYFANTFLVTVPATAGSIGLGILAGYVFSKLPFREASCCSW